MTVVTWNPADKAAQITLSGGNLVATCGDNNARGVRATISKSAGKFYWEGTLTATTFGTDNAWGVAQAGFSLAAGLGDASLNSAGWYSDGSVHINNVRTTGYPAPILGGVIGIAWDSGGALMWFTADGVTWNLGGGANPATGVGGFNIAAASSGAMFPVWVGHELNSVGTANFSGAAFAFAAPAGFTVIGATAVGTLAPFPWMTATGGMQDMTGGMRG